MAIAWKKHLGNPSNSKDGQRPKARQDQNGGKPSLPEWMRNLDLLCTQLSRHDLPTRMVFIGESLSDREAMAVYACSAPHCTWREGYVIDRRTGNTPHRLFGGFHSR